jgi:hypothetical protein
VPTALTFRVGPNGGIRGEWGGVLEIVYVRVLVVVVPKFISKSERLSDTARRGSSASVFGRGSCKLCYYLCKSGRRNTNTEN